MIVRGFRFARLLPVCLPLPAVAQPSAVVSSATLSVSPVSSGSVLQLLLGLGLVIALIFLLAWVARRFGGVSGFQHPQLKVVATLAMGTRERVVLVQAGEQQLLLGVAAGQINLLHTFEQPLIDPRNTPKSQFAERLRDAMKKGSTS